MRVIRLLCFYCIMFIGGLLFVSFIFGMGDLRNEYLPYALLVCAVLSAIHVALPSDQESKAKEIGKVDQNS
ncbi:hypothetical protein J2S05_002286 [Alkalicoccobacillus murimartini]|uniref:Uncharacterized protein n=1 Tax=Alkalicoccobacillus murimartini TaxID=171685 RepID=A0ABT9YI01_9BACI|nr:hypothetical protein [Alkalicoccobacillus murimartini]